MKEKQIERYGRDRKKTAKEEGFEKEKNLTQTGGKVMCSLLLGLAGEVCLDQWLAFSHGAKCFPALVMLWICLSILTGALLESAEAFRIKTEKNSCSFSENMCILKDECQENSSLAHCSEKVHRTIIAFSRARFRVGTGRRLRDVC